MTVASDLHDLNRLISLMDEDMIAYFEDGERNPQVESKLMSYRRILLKLVNHIIDSGDEPDWVGIDRVGVLWGMVAENLERYGIIPTEDRKMFTFRRDIV